MKIAESYSVIVIPRDRAKVRRWVFSRERILGVLGLSAGFVIFTLALFLGFLHYQQAYFATSELRNRGEQYEKERVQVLARLDELEMVVNDNEQIVSKLEVVTGLQPPSGIMVGIGGEAISQRPSVFKLASLEPKGSPLSDTQIFDETTLRSYNLRAIDLVEEAKETGNRLKEIYEFNGEAQYFWSALPTISPVRGWVTSDFGLRRSPLSGRRQLHEGVDIASPYGSVVVATGDGMVTLAGRHGGLGKKLMIDHGFGLTTVYGHSSEILVREGEKVKRGQIVAKVGSTGRSTGPHLHYEVLVNGIPVDPRRFILEQL